MTIKPIILSGGSGTRLWPLSRQSWPKQFIPIFKDKSLLDFTIERSLKIDKKTSPIVIVNKKYKFFINNAFQKYKLTPEIILEPVGKNTTAAIYMAAKYSKFNDELLIMPSDHIITDTESFNKTILEATKIVKNNCWVTFGITPNTPSEAYGYIKIIDENNLIKKPSFLVNKFIEKPNVNKAIEMIAEGGYFWNSGIFFAKRDVIINSIKKYAPNIAEKCDLAWNNSDHSTANLLKIDHKSYNLVPSQSIDYAVMEKEKNIRLIPINYSWSDIGSWDSFSDNQKNKQSKNLFEIDSSNNFVKSDNKIIATIGIQDTIIIDSNDATLIVKKGHTEKVKEIYNQLVAENRKEAIEHDFEYRPWGYFKNLINSKNFKVKYLTVKPGQRLSLQYHKKRSEHWIIIEGTATVHLNGEIKKLNSGMSIDIPCLANHYVGNYEESKLTLIEVQMGTYFGEDDIVRIDDPYER